MHAPVQRGSSCVLGSQGQGLVEEMTQLSAASAVSSAGCVCRQPLICWIEARLTLKGFSSACCMCCHRFSCKCRDLALTRCSMWLGASVPGCSCPKSAPAFTLTHHGTRGAEGAQHVHGLTHRQQQGSSKHCYHSARRRRRAGCRAENIQVCSGSGMDCVDTPGRGSQCHKHTLYCLGLAHHGLRPCA